MHRGLTRIIKMQLRFIKNIVFFMKILQNWIFQRSNVQNIKVLTTKRRIWCARSMIYEKMLQKYIQISGYKAYEISRHSTFFP